MHPAQRWCAFVMLYIRVIIEITGNRSDRPSTSRYTPVAAARLVPLPSTTTEERQENVKTYSRTSIADHIGRLPAQTTATEWWTQSQCFTPSRFLPLISGTKRGILTELLADAGFHCSVRARQQSPQA